MEVVEVKTSSVQDGVFRVRFLGSEGDEVTVTMREPDTGSSEPSLVERARSMMADAAGSDLQGSEDADIPPADAQEVRRAFSGEVAPEDASPRESLGEDDDNAYQNPDEALPSREEERALERNPSREGGRFDRF